mmetsp:Transcript_140995/g.316127  ORF Transcript_140995/g.316127 Transcript_140995/m.316127 type:complete len:328 (-) Transcript_140995:958-1941(-)
MPADASELNRKVITPLDGHRAGKPHPVLGNHTVQANRFIAFRTRHPRIGDWLKGDIPAPAPARAQPKLPVVLLLSFHSKFHVGLHLSGRGGGDAELQQRWSLAAIILPEPLLPLLKTMPRRLSPPGLHGQLQIGNRTGIPNPSEIGFKMGMLADIGDIHPRPGIVRLELEGSQKTVSFLQNGRQRQTPRKCRIYLQLLQHLQQGGARPEVVAVSVNAAGLRCILGGGYVNVSGVYSWSLLEIQPTRQHVIDAVQHCRRRHSFNRHGRLTDANNHLAVVWGLLVSLTVQDSRHPQSADSPPRIRGGENDLVSGFQALGQIGPLTLSQR